MLMDDSLLLAIFPEAEADIIAWNETLRVIVHQPAGSIQRLQKGSRRRQGDSFTLVLFHSDGTKSPKLPTQSRPDWRAGDQRGSRRIWDAEAAIGAACKSNMRPRPAHCSG